MNKLKLLLTLPGNGVHTVHTAKERKERLREAIYGTADLKRAQKIWEAKLDKLPVDKPLVLGIPSDNGGGIQRGANWGPLAIRGEILREKDRFNDLGDVRVIPHLLHDKYLNEKTIRDCRKALYGKVIKLPVSPLSIAEEAVKEVYKKNPLAKILGFGGDHSTSYPLVKEWILSRKEKKKAGILHFDAHTDLLVDRLGIDLCFGTWTYQVLEFFKSRDHLLQVGIRSSGKTKAHWKKNVGIEQIWADEVTKNGAEKTLNKIVKHFKKLGVEELYISFDIDALDEKYAAATGTPETGGLLPSDCAVIIRLLAKEFKITGADLMEVAPFVLPEGVDQRDQKSSLTVAGDMARLLLDVLK
ncbi:MAG: arginase family protein [Bdellovibrionota bacterium]